jgi:hypothetical protein
MSGEAVAKARIVLFKEIANTEMLVNASRFQDAENNLSKVDGLYRQLAALIDMNNPVHKTIMERSRMRIDFLCQDVEDGVVRREDGKQHDGNIAFKCNWNDKNYMGVCSESAYRYNQIHGGPWCRYSRCREFTNLQTPPDECCYESRAMIDCNFGAGWNHDKNGKGIKPRIIKSARRGKIALLVTQPPYTRHYLVVGAFKIFDVKDDPGKETCIYGDKETLLDDMIKYEIKFWNYYKNPYNPDSQQMSSGLFRYIPDGVVFGVLGEYINKKNGEGGDSSKAQVLVEALKKRGSK